MNTKTILFIILGLVVIAGGIGAVLFIKKDSKKNVVNANNPTLPTKKFINLPLNNDNYKTLMNQLLLEKELDDLQGWLLLIIKERKKAKQAGTNKWIQADTEIGLLKSALYELDKKNKLNSIELNDVYQQLAMLDY